MEPFEIHPHTLVGPARLTVADLSRSLGFYEGVLGMRPQLLPDGTTALGTGGAPLILLEERPGARSKPRGTTGLYHIALLMPSRLELARVLRRLAEQHYPLSGASDHLVSEAIYLDDPDGNGLEIYADRPRDLWPRAGRGVRMTSDPFDLDSVLAELERDPRPWEGLAPGSSVGHIHLHVANLDAAHAFYSGVLGFQVMQRFGPGALFVSAGGYHHHLGLNTWAGVGAPPPPPDAVGLQHFGVRLPDAAALAAVVDRVRAAGLPVAERADGLMVRDPAQNSVLLTQ